ncbi:MAG: hypothetical protein COC01_08595 [Bacteroidetes bacterium]|nr:MAG: hypothetical protein COC01_08595 [Bacteroidota bacterium]
MNSINEANICNYIEALRKVKAIEYGRKHNLFRKIYYSIKPVFKDLNKLGRAFEYELQNLPLNCLSASSRKTFLNNLCHNLLEIRKGMAEQYEQEIQPDFKFNYKGNNVVLKEFPDYDKSKHPSKTDYENHKVHFMYEIQYRAVNRAIDMVRFYANNEVTDLTKINKNHKAGGKKSIDKEERIFSPLPVPQLTWFLDLVNEAITDRKRTKSELALYISSTYATPRTKNPSKLQVYKALFDPDTNTLNGVKNIIIEMLNKVNEQL